MGETIRLKSQDGFELDAYLALPSGKPRGGVVVMQEIFGINPHMRRDTEKFAEHGYAALAPAVFDRVEKGVELGYDQHGFTKGRELVGQIGWDKPLMDVQAAAEMLREYGNVGGVGYCWGGSLAWLAATRLGIPSVGYYGGRTASLVDEKPKAPVMLHFGERDTHIPMTDVEKIRAAHPKVPVHVYDAGHGFNCDDRPDFDEAAAKLALDRTLDFLKENVG